MGLKWYRQLYTDDKAGGKTMMYRWQLEHGCGCPGMYVITLSTHERMLLDIVPAAFIRQKAVRRRLPMIIGMAFGRDSACELAARVISDVYDKTAGVDVRRFFQEERQKG